MLSDIEVVDWDIHHGNGTQIEKLEDFGQKKLYTISVVIASNK